MNSFRGYKLCCCVFAVYALSVAVFQVSSSVLQQNEIDLNALMLMSEQDFAEIGLPAVSRRCTVLKWNSRQ